MPEELRVKFEKLIADVKTYASGHEGHAHEAYINGALAHLATAQTFMDSHFDGITQEQAMGAQQQAIEQIRRDNAEMVAQHNEELMANRERSDQFHADLAAQYATGEDPK